MSYCKVFATIAIRERQARRPCGGREALSFGACASYPVM